MTSAEAIREAAAKVCDERARLHRGATAAPGASYVDPLALAHEAEKCALEIRALCVEPF